MTISSDDIEATIETDPLCQQIVFFLLRNEAAMDTSRGVAAWWVHSDEVAVQAALDCLTACRVVTTHTFTSGTLYGLTRNPEIRSLLRTMYAIGPEETHTRLGTAAIHDKKDVRTFDSTKVRQFRNRKERSAVRRFGRT